MRGTITLGGTSPRATFRVQAGAEKFDNYKAGSFDVEDTRPLFADGTLRQTDTVDTNFGFNFRAFPDPFNLPYRPDRCGDPEFAGGRKVCQRLGAVQGRRAPQRSRALPEPPHGRRRLPGLRAAVLLQRHVVAAQQSRQDLGALRSPGDHAVARESVADGLLPAARAPAAHDVARAVSGAHGRGVLPDRRHAPRMCSPIPSSASGRPAWISTPCSCRRTTTC